MNRSKSLPEFDKVEVLILIALTVMLETVFYFSAMGYQMLSYPGAIAIVICSLALSLERSTYLFFLLVANQRLLVLPFSDISLINLVIAVVISKQVISKKLELKYSTVLLIILYLTYSLAPSYMGENLSSLVIFVRVVLLFMMLNNIKNYSGSDETIYTKIIVYYALGCIIMGLLGVFFDPNFVVGTSYRFMGSELNNPNDYSMVLIIGVSALLILFNLYKNSAISILGLVIVLSFFGFLTQSRTFIFGYLIALGWYLLFSKKKMIPSAKSIAIGIMVIIIVLGLISASSFRAAVESSVDRIINPRRGDISGSRLDLWHDYTKFLLNNASYLIFGTGSNSAILYNAGLYHVAHNSVIELVVNWGLLGAVLSLAVFGYFRNRFLDCQIRQLRWSMLFAYMPLVILIVLSFTRHAPLNISFITSFYLGMMIVKLYYLAR